MRRRVRHARAAQNDRLLHLNGFDLVRRYFPTASSELTESILWSRTGFPSFWRPNGRSVAQQILDSVAEYKRALAYAERHGLRLCDFCESLASHGSDYCVQHGKALSQSRA